MDERLAPDDITRVLARAQEIEAAHGLGDLPVDEDRGVSAAALVAAAGEVGIGELAVRDSLALERFTAVESPGALDRFAGVGTIVVDHVVRRRKADALDDIESWLTSTHQMRCIRLPDGSVEFRPRSGFVASMRRSVNEATGDVTIRSVERITVTAVALTVGATPDRPRTAVQIVADRTSSRSRRLGTASLAGASGVGVAVAGVLGAVAFWPLVTIPLLGGGYVAIRSGGSSAERVELELLRILAALDRDERPAGLLGRARRAITKRS